MSEVKRLKLFVFFFLKDGIFVLIFPEKYRGDSKAESFGEIGSERVFFSCGFDFFFYFGDDSDY